MAHSASYSLPHFPRTYATTYPLRRPSRERAGLGTYLVSSGCTYGLNTVSFHSVGFEVSFAAVSAHRFARALQPWLPTSCQ